MDETQIEKEIQKKKDRINVLTSEIKNSNTNSSAYGTLQVKLTVARDTNGLKDASNTISKAKDNLQKYYSSDSKVITSKIQGLSNIKDDIDTMINMVNKMIAECESKRKSMDSSVKNKNAEIEKLKNEIKQLEEQLKKLQSK